MSKKKIAVIIFISAFVIVVLPFVLEIAIFRNDVYSVLSNGEWGGFLGSYIGGALGGIGTLLAVYITTLRVKSSIIKNNSSIWIYGIFKLAHLRKIQTPRKELFHV